MKKNLVIGLVIIALAGATAWYKRTDILLALVSFKTDRQYADIKPFHLVPWGQGPVEAETPSNERPPNIILIVADDLGFNDISTFGGGVAGGRIQTPNIDQLANDGVVFRQSYSGANTCAISRGMLMTGRYPSRTGLAFTPTPDGMGKLITGILNASGTGMPPAEFDAELAATKPLFENQGLPAEEVTVAEILKDRGYYTAHIGKWHLGRNNGMAPNHQGFEDSLLMQSGLYLNEDSPNVVNATMDFDPIDAFLWARMRYAASFNDPDGESFVPGGYLTDYWTDESIRVIEKNKNRPFFLYLAHWGIHTPLQATREDYLAVGDIKPHRLRVYAAMIRTLDRSVGRITESLEEQGLSDNTIIMFTSDNGGPGYIGLPEINQPFRGWKATTFEGGIRVPLFMKWPAKLVAGTQVEAPVAHIDIMPTLLAAAQAQVPDNIEIDGKSVLPLLSVDGQTGTQSSAEVWSRDTLFWVIDHSQVVRHKNWKLQLNDRRTDGQKMWLYDLNVDPTEKNNLAELRPDIVSELQALLDQYNASARKPLFPATVQAPVLIDKTIDESFEEGDEYVYTPL
ncbi:MAG: sulfatase-like hydrolase/transferase [Arenicella sp.]|nr:sulfatase-like hydrolase/transferase [Arenicella sp.]